MYEVLTIFAAFTFLYSVVAGGLGRTPISGAIVFVAFGWLIGPLALDIFDLDVSGQEIKSLAELTLGVLLFTDAANLDLSVLKRYIGVPQRLLLIGLPLTILFGFGAAVVGHTVDTITAEAVIYALLSLTLIRMLPVFLALTGSGLTLKEKLFAGWFGPRGMASIVFAVIVIDAQLPDDSVFRQVAVATIVLSIVLHGLSANPLIASLFPSEADEKG